jgi:hypothetical protein
MRQRQPPPRMVIPPLHIQAPLRAGLGEVDVQREAGSWVGGGELVEGGGQGVVGPVADGVEEEDLFGGGWWSVGGLMEGGIGGWWVGVCVCAVSDSRVVGWFTSWARRRKGGGGIWSNPFLPFLHPWPRPRLPILMLVSTITVPAVVPARCGRCCAGGGPAPWSGWG